MFFSVILYYLLPGKVRNLFLLIINFVFYILFLPFYAFILCFIVLTGYFGGIELSIRKNYKKLFYSVLVLNILPLVFFKYLNFFSLQLSFAAKNIGWNYGDNLFSIVLPVGISFYIFKNLSYIIDVKNKTIEPERNFIIYANYVSFFPALLSGPIDRAKVLIPQFKISDGVMNKKRWFFNGFEIENIMSGLKLLLFGFFQKIVVADRLAIFVNNVYDNPQNFKGINIIIATLLFSFQILNDFSGYTNIALGSAYLFGFKLSDNFKRPYISESVSEFWRRWHITLSTWLRDYIFLPVSYSLLRLTNGKFKNQPEIFTYIIATIITMLIAGIWHGNGLTFILWGLMLAFYMSFSIIIKKRKKKFIKLIGFNNKNYYRYIRIISTYLFISLSWVFFRIANIEALNNLFSGIDNIYDYFSDITIFNGITYFVQPKLELLFSILFIFSAEYLLKYDNYLEFLRNHSILARWATYYFLLFSILLFGVFKYNKFIYFQF